MKKIILITSLLMIFISCKSQQIILPLNTRLSQILPNSYLKDSNNVLDEFVGTYKFVGGNSSTTLFITKITHKPQTYPNYHFSDVLMITFIVKSNSVILQDNQNCFTNCIEIESLGDVPQIQSLAFSNAGNNCGIGDGLIYIKKINANQISWSYTPQGVIYDDVSCPPNIDKTIYLPVGKDIIFTKQ